jgi:hypothetical protein
MHLLGGIIVRPLLLWILKFYYVAGPSSSSPWAIVMERWRFVGVDMVMVAPV